MFSTRRTQCIMKKVLLALTPAIIVQFCWLLINRPPIKHDYWVMVIVAILIFGGVLSARLLIGYLQEANVERGPVLKLFIGAIVVILYVAVFFFTGCTIGLITGA